MRTKMTDLNLKIVHGEDVIKTASGFRKLEGVRKYVKDYMQGHPRNLPVRAVVEQVTTTTFTIPTGKGKAPAIKLAPIHVGSAVKVIEEYGLLTVGVRGTVKFMSIGGHIVYMEQYPYGGKLYAIPARCLKVIPEVNK
jgi:hypothetical protein